jgi:hypothetical protein
MIAQSVADILSHHVKLSLEGIDRMYLNVFVPRLQHEMGIVGFFRQHRGQPLPSAALMQPMSRAFVAKLESFTARAVSQGAAQGRRDEGASAQIPQGRGHGFRRQGAGEDAGVPH